MREISLLKKIQHANCVPLLDIIVSDSNLYLVFEYLNSDLKNLLDQSHKGLDLKIVKGYLYQLLSGLRYCHSHRIIHRDLKPQNLLIDKRGSIKIGDFGLGREFCMPNRVYTHEVVTLWYRSPEILLGTDYYGPSLDLWSLGCIFSEMTNNKVLFSGDSEIDQIYRIFRTLGTPTLDTCPDILKLPDFTVDFPKWPRSKVIGTTLLNEDGKDLLARFLEYDHNRRITAAQALKHPYFDDVDECLLSNSVDVSARKCDSGFLEGSVSSFK